MADDKQVKKGMRTFASDFERAKNKRAEKKVPKPDVATDTPTTPTKKVPVSPKKPDTEKKEEKQTSGAQQAISDILQETKEPATPKKTIPANKATKKSVPQPERAVGGGTIITDTKDESFSLLPEVSKSVTGWFSSLTKKKKKAPKLAIPETSRRKGVIQAATTKSGTIFTADSETLKERIKARQRAAEMQDHDPETIWTPNTDAGYALLEGEVASTNEPEVVEEAADATDNVTVTFKKQSVPTLTPTPETIAQEVQAQVTEPVVETEPKAVTPVIETAPVEPEPLPTPTPPEPEPKPKPKPKPIKSITPVEEPDFSDDELRLPDDAMAEADDRLSTNVLTAYIIGILAALAVLGVLGYLIYSAYTNQIASLPPQAEDYIANATQTGIMVDNTFTAETITQTTADATLGTQEYYLQNTDGVVLPTALVFDLVAPDLPVAVQQYTTDVRFVAIDRSAPITYITLINQLALQGELLTEEANLSNYFADLYDAPTEGSYLDQQVDGVDARVLTDELGRTYLTYGFINDETLIITATLEDFATFVRN